MRDNDNGEFVKRGTRRPAFGNGVKGKFRKENRNTDHEEIGSVSDDRSDVKIGLLIGLVVLAVLGLLAAIFVPK